MLTYELFFQIVGEIPGRGFTFPCDESGKVDTNALNITQLRNYVDCVNGPFHVESGIVRLKRS